MFGQNSNELLYNYSSEFQFHFPPPQATANNKTFPLQPLFLPPLAIPSEHDWLSALRTEFAYTSSGCSSYGGSPTSITSYGAYSLTGFERSIGIHSIQQMENYSPMNSSPPGRFFELEETSSVGKALLNNGDLWGVKFGQHNNQRSNIPLATESNIIESMNRASPYSPEEKKERIERYRNKRNLRNFNKKIRYECRKTLADSRLRIRGRFAKNDETDQKMPQSQRDQTGIEDYDEDDENWINLLHAFSANYMIP